VEGGLQIPLILIAGAKPGPTLLVTSGLHGDEYDGLEAVLRLAEQTDPASLAGTLAIIPRVNVRAFEQGWRWSHIDGLDLNRQFPGRPDGFAAQRLAWFLSNTILPQADVVLDFHGGTTELEVVSYGAAAAPSPMKEELTELLGVKHIWDWSETTGMRGTFSETAEARDIPILMVEIGGNNTWRDGPVEDGLVAARNTMRYFNMIDGPYEGIPDEQIHMRGTFIHADADGFLRPKVKLGQPVQEGEVLAEIVDLLGQTRCQVRSPVTGIINDIRTAPSIRCGEWLYLVGRVVERRKTKLGSAGASSDTRADAPKELEPAE
jgi:predicted deacylase